MQMGDCGEPTCMRVIAMARFCRITGCGSKYYCRGLCVKHYGRWKEHGDGFESIAVRPMRPRGSGGFKAGYFMIRDGERVKFEHVVIAERALRKPMPQGAVVHHVDLNPSNNDPANLVICPSQAYHLLLHQRQRAMDACGNPNWRKCGFCKRYDDPVNLRILKNPRTSPYHAECSCQRGRDQRKAAKELKKNL